MNLFYNFAFSQFKNNFYLIIKSDMLKVVSFYENKKVGIQRFFYLFSLLYFYMLIGELNNLFFLIKNVISLTFNFIIYFLISVAIFYQIDKVKDIFLQRNMASLNSSDDDIDIIDEDSLCL